MLGPATEKFAGDQHHQLPNRTDTNRTEPFARENPAIDTAWTHASGKSLLGSGQFAQDYIDDAVQRHGATAVLKAIRQARVVFPHVPTPQALAAAVRNMLDPFPDHKAVEAKGNAEQAAESSRRRVQATKASNHGLGFHADQPDPGCDLCRSAA